MKYGHGKGSKMEPKKTTQTGIVGKSPNTSSMGTKQPNKMSYAPKPRMTGKGPSTPR